MNKIWARTLIDISIIANFILLEFTEKVKISLQKKSDIYQVTDIDKRFLEYNKEIIDYKIKEIRLYIRSYVNNM